MKNKFLIPVTIGMCLVTITLAYYSAGKIKLEIVNAQNPYPNGCFNVITNLTECPGWRRCNASPSH